MNKYWILLTFLLIITWPKAGHAVNSFSYSGQLVGDKGVPTDGTVNLTFVLYKGSGPGTEICRQRINGVSLNQGFFSVDLDFPHTDATYRCQLAAVTVSLTQALSDAIDSNEDIFIEIIDETNAKTFRQQLIATLPESYVSNQLTQKGANQYDLLYWDNGNGIWRADGALGVSINDSSCEDGSLLIYDGAKFDCAKIDSTLVPPNSIDTAELQDGSVTGAKFADGAIQTTNIIDGSITGDKIQDGSINSQAILDGSVATTQIQDGAITNPKFVDNTLQTAKFQNNSITAALIPDNEIETAVIADDTFATANIADANITGVKLQDDAVTDAKIAVGITADKIVDLTLTGAKIQDGAINSAKVADNSINATELNNDSIASAKFANNAVTTAKLTDNSIVSADINDGDVTNVKIADQNITDVKMQGIAANCGADNIMVSDGAGGFHCQRNIWGGAEAMMMWHDTGSIPTGWSICGTANLNNRYLKGAVNDGELNDIGGSANHDHTWTSDNMTHDHNWSYTDNVTHQHTYQDADSGNHDHDYTHRHTETVDVYYKTFLTRTAGGPHYHSNSFGGTGSPWRSNQYGHNHAATSITTQSGNTMVTVAGEAINVQVGVNATMSNEQPSWATTSSSTAVTASGTTTSTVSDPPFTRIVYLCYTGP